ncbi:SRPBCC family protein [Gelidibacter sp.]|uniref:SRPBCC family protein n=1 Tax=Gelidibacter sp. TaxID=2018083 RepID=UPI002CE4439E|nr:SRPBCC family protein [Gelidibacter sp.]HUH27474.1 hypothetical protein [Gelidibacter sp.]
MKFSLDIVIEAPLEICAKKFNSTENMKHWQRGLVAVEHLSGIPGEFGARMKLYFKIGKRQVGIMETITHKNFPNEFHALYAAEELDNQQENYFTATSENHTKWTCTSEFIPLSFKMRLMLGLMPNTFKKQTLQYMRDFKNFVEKGISVCVN